MSSSGVLKKNFFYNFSYQFLAVVVPLITSPYVSRVLGVKNIGISSWVNSIVFYFGIFIALGVENYGNREIAYVSKSKEKRSKKFWGIFFCQIVNFCIVSTLYFFYISFFSDSSYKVFFMILTVNLLSKLLDISWFFNGMENFKITVLRNTVIKFLILICIFLFVKERNDLWKFILINALGTLIGQLSMWPSLKKYIYFYFPTKKEIFQNFKPLCILFIPVLAISVFSYMDKYMIGLFSSVTQNGYYENADKIINIPKTFVSTIGAVMLPRTANLLSSNREKESLKYIELSMIYTILIGCILSFGMAAVSDVFAIVFWGKNFLMSGVLIAILSPTILFSIIGGVIRSQYLIPNAKDKEYTISLVICAAINFCVNIVTIKKYGAIGAVIGTLCSEFILMILQLYYVRKVLPLKKYFLNTYMFFLIGFIMYVAMLLIKSFFSNAWKALIVCVFVGGILYLLLLILYVAKSKNESAKILKYEILSILKTL